MSDVVDHAFIHSIYAHDPNGIPIEFSHNVEGADIQKNPQMTDKAPSPITLEGADSQRRIWFEVATPASKSERMIYPGAGSELFRGKRSI